MQVSNSRIQTYKSCRRMYELKYVYGMIPVKNSEAIDRGLSYHEKVEQILKDGGFQPDENVKSNAMAEAFMKYIAPYLDAVAQEEWFNYKTESGNEVVGRIDARNRNGCLIEHKTTSGEIDEAYWYNLENNEQVLTYMSAYDTDSMIYTVCRTPSIKQKKNETDEEFEKRCLEWYDEDTERKITFRVIYRDKADIDAFKKEQDATINEMANCKLFYRNESHCMKWGKMCEYAPICRTFDPNQEYIEFTRKEE